MSIDEKERTFRVVKKVETSKGSEDVIVETGLTFDQAANQCTIFADSDDVILGGLRFEEEED